MVDAVTRNKLQFVTNGEAHTDVAQLEKVGWRVHVRTQCRDPVVVCVCMTVCVCVSVRTHLCVPRCLSHFSLLRSTTCTHGLGESCLSPTPLSKT